jgi:hypothetical protein
MSQIVMPVSPEEFHKELEHMADILVKWRDKIGKEGIVGVDQPAADAELKYEQFIREFTGELLYVGGKCQNLALILSER